LSICFVTQIYAQPKQILNHWSWHTLQHKLVSWNNHFCHWYINCFTMNYIGTFKHVYIAVYGLDHSPSTNAHCW